jgi:two-component system cell cycle response regulator
MGHKGRVRGPKGTPSSPPRDDESRDEDQTKVGDAAGAPRSTRRDRAHLIVLAGESLGQMFRVERSEMVMGRAADAAIRLQDDGVSRHHARVAEVQGELCIEDLNSANGTLLNDQRIHSAVLRDGDKIQMGSTTILKFTYADELEENFRRRMHDVAIYDALTKACDKSHFLYRLQTEVSYARRHTTPLSLLMLDVDHLQHVNDHHGYPAGDGVLTTLAQIVRRTLRAEDLFARYGGEEFAVLCRGAIVDNALKLAERLRAKVETFVFEHHGQRIPVTISVGVASWFDQPDSTAQLIADAEAALHKAKARGRNRVVVRAVHPA